MMVANIYAIFLWFCILIGIPLGVCFISKGIIIINIEDYKFDFRRLFTVIPVQETFGVNLIIEGIVVLLGVLLVGSLLLNIYV